MILNTVCLLKTKTMEKEVLFKGDLRKFKSDLIHEIEKLNFNKRNLKDLELSITDGSLKKDYIKTLELEIKEHFK